MAMKLKEMSKNPLISPKSLIPEFLPSCSVPLLRFQPEGAGQSGCQNPGTTASSARMPRYDSGSAEGCSMPIHLCGSICVWFYVLGLQIWTWFLRFSFTDPINTTLVPINTTHPSRDLHRCAWVFYLIVNIFDSFYL